MGSLFKKPETLLYPFQKKTPYSGQKGHIVNNVDECILCGMCQRVCPCHCILVSKPERRWEINPFSCILCGSCTRSCPTKCLTMSPDPTDAVNAKYDIDLNVPENANKGKKAAEETKAENV